MMRCLHGAVRAARRPQRAVPVRLGEEIQALPRSIRVRSARAGPRCELGAGLKTRNCIEAAGSSATRACDLALALTAAAAHVSEPRG